jgi:hypothetical protein
VFEKNYRLQDIQLSKIAGSLTRHPLKLHREPALSRFANREPALAGLPDMVENTGLEPVTSWLQTRRSPS